MDKENKELVIVPLEYLQERKEKLSKVGDIIPEASNFLIENSFTLTGFVGTIIEHYSEKNFVKPFNKSQTRLSDHLKLRGVSSQDKLGFTEEQWTQIKISLGKDT